MLYVVYNQETDIDEVRTESLTEALQQATEIYDKTYDQRANQYNDKNYSVQIIDMDEKEYESKSWDDIKNHLCSNSSLYQFITTYGLDVIREPVSLHENKLLINTEVYHNLDEAEQREVLAYVSDDMLLYELERRIAEYRIYSDKISKAREELKIYV